MAVLVQAERRSDTERNLGWLLAAAAAEFALLAVTGLFLVFFYRPPASRAWFGVKPKGTAVTLVDVVRVAHRISAYGFGLTLLTVAAIAVILVVSRSLRTRGHRLTAAAAIGAAASGFFATLSGLLLPWDQLALWSVTVGTNMMGFRPILGSAQVQYVLVAGSTVSVHTFRRMFYFHTVGTPVLLLALGFVMAWRLRRGPATQAVAAACDDDVHGPYVH